MRKRILLIQGHPDTSHDHLCHRLADAYASGATEAGHFLRRTDVASLDFPLLRSQDFRSSPRQNNPAKVAAA